MSDGLDDDAFVAAFVTLMHIKLDERCGGTNQLHDAFKYFDRSGSGVRLLALVAHRVLNKTTGQPPYAHPSAQRHGPSPDLDSALASCVAVVLR
jgi:hypothetical protein